MKKSRDAFRTISEVAEWLGTPTHVLRFWESRFSQVKPVKRAGGRRYYRPSDMELLGGIKKLLHDDGMTIRGVQKLLREEGVRHVASLSASLGDTNVDDSTDAGIVIDVTVETPSTGASDEAPIDLDVAQAPPENVVQFDNVHASEEIQKATDTPPAPVPDQPEEASAEIPVATKIIADVPDDPEDDEGTSGLNIISVAESLRRMADVQVADSVKTDVFAKLYDRLTRLRQRMDAPANHDSSD